MQCALTVALVSAPCIAPGTLPCGIAVLKRQLSEMGVRTTCLYLANLFEQELAAHSSDLSEVYDMASEVGYDHQSPYFAGLVYDHCDADALVTRSVRRTFTGRAGLPKTLDDLDYPKSRLETLIRRETRLGLSFCRQLRRFCEQSVKSILAASPCPGSP